MKILMFNHHPDVLHYMWRAFTELGHEVLVADEQLTLKYFSYSSTKENKFEVVNKLYSPKDLFPDMSSVKFVGESCRDLERLDIVWSMLPEVTRFTNVNTWFDGQMQIFLRDPKYSSLPGIKSANHPDAKKLNNFYFVGNWVSPLPVVTKKRDKLVQLITQAHLIDSTYELMFYRSKGIPVVIAGGDKCPDGFIKDTDILPETAMLAHNKDFGINCYAVCKALDMGVPVFMSKKTKEKIGFNDLPNDLFLFREDYACILDALEVAKTKDPSYISHTYRSIYTLDRTISQIENIIETERK